FRAAKCAHLGASAQGWLRGPGDRHHAARPGDSKSQEAAQRDLHEAYWPVAAKDRRGAGARFFYDGGDGQGFRLSRQGNRSSAGDATACSRVLNECALECPLCAISRLMQCSVKLIHAVSFTSFANRIDSDMRES